MPAARKPADTPETPALLDHPPVLAPAPVDGLITLPAPPDMAGTGVVRLMAADEYAARLARLRAPFGAEDLERLPKPLNARDNDRGRCSDGYSADGFDCGGRHARSIHLTYIGHAGITARLLEVDPLYSLEPVETVNGVPVVRPDGAWFRLTVLGMTRLGFGDAGGKSGPNAIKEVIGDALRNAAMRFGVATYLWSKSEAAQVLAAGGETDDAPPHREPAPPRQARRAAAERAAASQDAMPPATAIAFRQSVMAAADETQPGDARDRRLRAIRDEVASLGGLAVPVPVPEPWHRPGSPEQVSLEQLILGARGVTTPSQVARPADGQRDANGNPEGHPDYDPWAVAPDEQEQQA